MNIQDWAESVFGVVEQDGAMTYRVRLITPATGEIWHTWHAPFAAPIDWAASAESRLRSLEQQCAGRQQVSFVAESEAGETLSQLPWKVIGKLQGGNLESVQQAAAAVFASTAQTVERITELSNRQLDAARQQVEITMQSQVQMMELLRMYRGREIETAPPAPSLLETALQNYGPQLGALAEMGVEWMRLQQQKAAIAPVGGPRKTKPPTRTVGQRKG